MREREREIEKEMSQSQSQNQELRFCQWLSQSPEMVGLIRCLPPEIFTQSGRDLLQRIHNNESLNISTSSSVSSSIKPFSAQEASEYLQAQLLAIIGREAGRAQQSHDLGKLQAAYNALDHCQMILAPPPVALFEAIDPQIREVIPTGIEPLDAQIRGLGNGELGFVALPPGRGKTLLLINFAVAALLDNKDVLYVTVADQSTDELLPRIDTCMLGAPLPYPTTQQSLSTRHKNAVKMLQGKLWVADYTDRECTITDIEQVISTCDADLIIIDHADDIITVFSPEATRHSLRAIYGELKRLSRKYEVPLWTASQSHEISWHTNITGIQDLVEAKVGKATGASIILLFSAGAPSIARPGLVYCTIAKARRDIRERILPLHFDFSLMRVW